MCGDDDQGQLPELWGRAADSRRPHRPCVRGRRAGLVLLPVPRCTRAVAKEATRRIVDLLVSSGVRMQVWRLPAELAEPRVGPPLRPDDLLDFHLMLQEDGWFERLNDDVRGVAEPPGPLGSPA